MTSNSKCTKDANISVICIHSQISSLIVYFVLIYKKGPYNLDQAGCFELSCGSQASLESTAQLVQSVNVGLFLLCLLSARPGVQPSLPTSCLCSALQIYLFPNSQSSASEP